MGGGNFLSQLPSLGAKGNIRHSLGTKLAESSAWRCFRWPKLLRIPAYSRGSWALAWSLASSEVWEVFFC